MEPLDALFGAPEMAAIFAPEAHVRGLLAFEAALARAQARAGVIPPAAADAIADACRIDLFDVPALYRAAAHAGTPVIPLVRALTALAGDAGRFVHWGATSQDAIDTALMLHMRDGLDLLAGRLLDVGAVCAALTERFRYAPMAGRTLLQQALPITFGLKAARWLALATRQASRMDELRARALVVQLGGAAGTLAALGAAGPLVTTCLSEELGLAEPELPWHAERDRVAEIAAAVGVVAGAMAKIAADVLLLAQTEVGELAEGVEPGKGASSALAHKRNPVDVTFALASARLAVGMAPVILSAMAHEHERAAGGWQAEWAALPALFGHAAGAVERVHAALSGLTIDTERMRANLALDGGLALAEALTVALAAKVGRPEAYRLTQAVSEHARERGGSLRSAALADERLRAILPPDEIERALDPVNYLGSADVYIERALARYRATRAARDAL